MTDDKQRTERIAKKHGESATCNPTSNFHTCLKGVSVNRGMIPCAECAREFWRAKAMEVLANPKDHLESWRSDGMIIAALVEFSEKRASEVRRETVEECAKIADAENVPKHSGYYGSLANDAASDMGVKIAEAIRALLPAAQKETPTK